MSKIDPFIFTSRTAWMQRCSDLARNGHVWYIRGTCPPVKAGFLWDKFDRLYDIGYDKLQASRARKTGLASSRFLLLARKDFGLGAADLEWILMRTDGKLNPAAQDAREKWQDLRENRIQVDGFEMVRLTRPGAAKPSWTWRYSRKLHDDLRNILIHSIRSKHDGELKIAIDRIWRAPGFSGIRDQGKKFMQLIQGEWKRTRTADTMPELPERFGYVRRIADKGVRLSALLRNAAKPSAAKEPGQE